MKKRTIILYMIIALFVCVFVVLSSYSQEDVKTVDDSGFVKKMRHVVVFLHDEHNEAAEIEDCNVCHHLYKDGKIVEDESSEDQECSECHGPIMCSECHPK